MNYYYLLGDVTDTYASVEIWNLHTDYQRYVGIVRYRSNYENELTCYCVRVHSVCEMIILLCVLLVI